MSLSAVFAAVLAVFAGLSSAPPATSDASRCYTANELRHRTEVQRCRAAHLGGQDLDKSPRCEAYLKNCEAGWGKACEELSACFDSRDAYQEHQACLDTERSRYEAQNQQCHGR